VVSCNPLPGIYGAVTRKVEENLKGSITPGKLADLAVLSENLLEITPEKLKDLKVILTILNGQIVWESS